MVPNFQIAATRPETATVDDLRHIKISTREKVLTRTARHGEKEDESLHVPAAPLAFWLIDNWWRLLFEPVPTNGPGASWRLAHELSSIGAGYIWPRMVIWGEGERVGITVRQEPVPTSIQFLTRGIHYVSTADVEHGADAFIRQTLDEALGDEALGAEYEALCAERADEDARTWRTLEALLGFDVDEAPAELVDSLGELVERYGEAGIEEAIAARPGQDAASALEAAVEAARRSNVCVELPAPIESIAFTRDVRLAPWEMAEEAATSLRKSLALTGPVPPGQLGDIFGVSSQSLRRATAPKWPYGLRLRSDQGDDNRIVLRTSRAQARRFELCRNVGDILWSGNDALGPVSDAVSSRQKFQRAFAQSFLCPYPELIAHCGPYPGQDEVAAAAAHFHVSERTIETILVNKGHMERDAFMDSLRYA